MIDKLKSQHAVQRLCQQLNVAMSGYLAHSHGKPSSERKQQDQRLLVYIRAAHARGRGIYGPLKIQTELAAQGVMAGINRIKRLRTLHGIRCTHKKKFRVTTDSKHLMPVARNLLDRQFACTAPNQVWVADITYIPTGEGWLYLAAVKDLYTCEIVGWSMDNRMTQTLVMDALTAAYWKKKPAPGLMHHSDRGSQIQDQLQYTDTLFPYCLRDLKIAPTYDFSSALALRKSECLWYIRLCKRFYSE